MGEEEQDREENATRMGEGNGQYVWRRRRVLKGGEVLCKSPLRNSTVSHSTRFKKKKKQPVTEAGKQRKLVNSTQ